MREDGGELLLKLLERVAALEVIGIKFLTGHTSTDEYGVRQMFGSESNVDGSRRDHGAKCTRRLQAVVALRELRGS
jgi:hypothetical protein